MPPICKAIILILCSTAVGSCSGNFLVFPNKYMDNAVHPAISRIFCHLSLGLISPDLPMVSHGTATEPANGEGMYLRLGTDGKRGTA